MTRGSDTIFGFDSRWIFLVLLLVLVIPSGIFLYTSYQRLGSILTQIDRVPEAVTVNMLAEARGLEDAVAIAAFRMRAKVALEVDVIAHRHQRSGAALATRTWLRFMSMMFGATLVVIGAAFVLGRITGPSSSAGVEGSGVAATIKSSSPGLFLVGFGCMLISVPNLSSQRIDTNDTASYIEKSFATVAASGQDSRYSRMREKALQDLLDRDDMSSKE